MLGANESPQENSSITGYGMFFKNIMQWRDSSIMDFFHHGRMAGRMTYFFAVFLTQAEHRQMLLDFSAGTESTENHRRWVTFFLPYTLVMVPDSWMTSLPFKHIRCNPDVAPRLTSGGHEDKDGGGEFWSLMEIYLMFLPQSTYCS